MLHFPRILRVALFAMAINNDAVASSSADDIKIPDSISQQAATANLQIRDVRVRKLDGALLLKIYNAGNAAKSVRIEMECIDKRGVLLDSFKGVAVIEPLKTWSVKQHVHWIRYWAVTALTINGTNGTSK